LQVIDEKEEKARRQLGGVDRLDAVTQGSSSEAIAKSKMWPSRRFAAF
jgi:hypothetical protein